MSDLVKRCQNCKAIESEGGLTPVTKYDILELEAEGIQFTDVIMSNDCDNRYNAGEIQHGLRKPRSNARYNKCPDTNPEEFTEAIFKMVYHKHNFMLGFDETADNRVRVEVRLRDDISKRDNHDSVVR